MGLRTLLVTVSPLLGDLVIAALLPYLTLDVIATLKTREGLAVSLSAWSPDIVLLGLLGGETETGARAVLALLPTAKILALAANGEPAWLLKADAPSLALANMSVSELARAVAACFDVPPAEG